MSCFPFLVNVDKLKGIVIGGGKFGSVSESVSAA